MKKTELKDLEARARRWDLVSTRAALMWSSEAAADKVTTGANNDALVDAWIAENDWPDSEQETRQ